MALAALAISLLPACSPRNAPQDYLSYRGGEEPARLAARLSDRVGACWFGAGEQAFSGYLYVPELNSYSGRPRILIVRASDPTGLPRLVVQASQQGTGSEVRLFGPMLNESQGRRAERDVARWVAGARDC